jgi:hypothetical protein
MSLIFSTGSRPPNCTGRLATHLSMEAHNPPIMIHSLGRQWIQVEDGQSYEELDTWRSKNC